MYITVKNFLIIPILGAFVVYWFDFMNGGQEPINCMYNMLLLLYGVVIGWMVCYEKTNR